MFGGEFFLLPKQNKKLFETLDLLSSTHLVAAMVVSELIRSVFQNATPVTIPTFLFEALDIIVMTLALGYIFSGIFKEHHPHHQYDPLSFYKKRLVSHKALKMAIWFTAPAVILHEAGHKIVALALGQQATFHAAYGWLFFGILLRLLGSNFIFFVPGYVAHSVGTLGETALVAFAGPFANLVLWLVAWYFLKHPHKLPKKYYKYMGIIAITKQINMFLFFFNMIPFAPFDGAKVFQWIFSLF